MVSRPFTARLERILLFAAIAGFVSALLAVILQGAIGQGATFWSAARPDTFVEVLGTRFGRAWGIAAGAWLVVLAVLATRPLRERDGSRFHIGPGHPPDPSGRSVAVSRPSKHLPPRPLPPLRRRSRPARSRRWPSPSSRSPSCPPWAATRACRSPSRC